MKDVSLLEIKAVCSSKYYLSTRLHEITPQKTDIFTAGVFLVCVAKYPASLNMSVWTSLHFLSLFCIFFLQELILADRRAKGEDVTKEPEMEIQYNESRDGLSRRAEEGEVPNVEFEPGIGVPQTPELYASVKRG